MHTHLFPSTLSVTQHKQMPKPHAIMFSSEASQSIFLSPAIFATAFIIGSGPQEYILSNLKLPELKTECCVTNPFSPSVPSSVVMFTSPNSSKALVSRMSFFDFPPRRKVILDPLCPNSFASNKKGAMPEPPPTIRTFFTFSVLKWFPRG